MPLRNSRGAFRFVFPLAIIFLFIDNQCRAHNDEQFHSVNLVKFTQSARQFVEPVDNSCWWWWRRWCSMHPHLLRFLTRASSTASRRRILLRKNLYVRDISCSGLWPFAHHQSWPATTYQSFRIRLSAKCCRLFHAWWTFKTRRMYRPRVHNFHIYVNICKCSRNISVCTHTELSFLALFRPENKSRTRDVTSPNLFNFRWTFHWPNRSRHLFIN